jgi:hypothetical protein
MWHRHRLYNARAQQCALRPPKLDSSTIKYDEATTLRLASRPSGWNCVLNWKKPDAELKEVVSAPPAALHQLGWQITRPGGWCRALDFAADTKCWTKRHFKTKTAAVISKAEMGGLQFRYSRIAICRVKHVQMCVSLFRYIYKGTIFFRKIYFISDIRAILK